MIFIIVCISWNNKKCFDTIDARCKHEDHQHFPMKMEVADSSNTLVTIYVCHLQKTAESL